MAKIMKSLNNISRCQAIYRNLKLDTDGINPCHHAFVLFISKNPGRTQEEISRELCLNKSTVARVLTHLESNNYIHRVCNQSDKRQLLIYPTEKMIELHSAVSKIAREWNESITSDISENELEIFHSVLNRIEEKAKKTITEIQNEKNSSLS